MIESVAWGIGTGISVWSLSQAIIAVYGKKHCKNHDKIIGVLFSDIASLKANFVLLSTYVTRHAEKEGIDLNERIIKSIMRKD